MATRIALIIVSLSFALACGSKPAPEPAPKQKCAEVMALGTSC